MNDREQQAVQIAAEMQRRLDDIESGLRAFGVLMTDIRQEKAERESARMTRLKDSFNGRAAWRDDRLGKEPKLAALYRKELLTVASEGLVHATEFGMSVGRPILEQVERAERMRRMLALDAKAPFAAFRRTGPRPGP